MSSIVWNGSAGLVLGLAPFAQMNETLVLPESVEAQVSSVVDNLGTLLIDAGLTRTAVSAVRVNLTQFQRFHRRAARALDRAMAETPSVQVSWVGVTDLPGDALVAMDIWFIRG